MTWYWRADDVEGCVEEFSLVIDQDDDGDEDSEESDKESEEESECVPILEGRRTENGGVEGSVNEGVLFGLKDVLKSNISPTSLLRFLVLITRAECNKTQGKLASITQGCDEPRITNSDPCTQQNSKHQTLDRPESTPRAPYPKPRP